jgi:hypothetical protein
MSMFIRNCEECGAEIDIESSSEPKSPIICSYCAFFPEHTCSGLYDLSCEACRRIQEEEDATRRAKDYVDYPEPEEYDADGGL